MGYQDFITHVKQIGIFGGNKFEFLAPPVEGGSNSNSTVVSMLCNSVTLPGINIMTTDIRYFGEVSERPHGINYGPVSLTFYLDNNLEPKRYFEQWLNEVYDRGTRAIKYYNDYTRDVEIVVYNKAEEEIDRIKLYECYPKSTQDINLSYDLNGAPSILNVVLVYKWWESTGKSSYKDRVIEEVDPNQKSKYGFDGLGETSETLGNLTGDTYMGNGQPQDLYGIYDDMDPYESFTTAGERMLTDSSRYMEVSSNMFDISNFSSSSYPDLGQLLGNNAGMMNGQIRNIGDNLVNIGNRGNVGTYMSNIHGYVGDMCNSMGMLSGLTQGVNHNMSREIGSVATNMSRTNSSVGVITNINQIPSYFNSLSSNFSTANSIMQQYGIRTGNVAANSAFKNMGQSFNSVGSNFSRVASSIYR